jgi:hypothetical protein
VVFEIFSGQAVFQGETPLVTLFKHLHEAPPLEGAWAPIPPPLVEPLRMALAKDPASRFESVARFQEALERARVECAPDAPLAPATPPPGGAETATILRPTPGPAHTAPAARASAASRRWALAAVPALVAVALAVLLVRVRTPPPAADAVGPTAGGTASPASPVAAPAAAPAPPAGSGVAGERRADVSPRPRSTPARELLADVRVPDLGASTTGTLRLTVIPPAEVTVDGRLVGTVSTQAVELPPGSHVVRVLHPDYKPLQRIVTIPPGGAFDLSLDLAEKGIRLER